MKNAFLLLLFSGLFISMNMAEPPSDIILGDWISQDKDGKITVYKQGDKYFGKISWSKTPGKKDVKNPNDYIMNLKNQDQNKNGKQQQKKEYTPIRSYKPSGNLVYDDELLSKIENKFI